MDECTIAEVTERPFLSIVVPAYNEEAVIGRFIDSVHADVDRPGLTWEAIIVDDGSADQTVRIVRDAAKADDRIRLVEAAHRGKGAAVRQGFLAARGQWVLMADADLSMPWDNLSRFLAIAVPRQGSGQVPRQGSGQVPRQGSGQAPRRDSGQAEDNAPDIIVGSREAPGAQRTGESWSRRMSGRVFNALVRIFAVPGIRDSQCGYKMLSADAVAALAPHLTIDGFAFDVELLYLARLAGFRIREVGITCYCRQDSRVRVRAGLASVLDVVRIRFISYSEPRARPAPASSPDRRRGSSYTP